jgi:hypothetical protein
VWLQIYDSVPVNNNNGGTPPQATSATVSDATSLSIARMNEDYLNLGVLGAIAVACVNHNDFTVNRGVDPNDWLNTNVCTSANLRTIVSLETTAFKNPQVVDPTKTQQVNSNTQAMQKKSPLKNAPQKLSLATVAALDVCLSKPTLELKGVGANSVTGATLQIKAIGGSKTFGASSKPSSDRSSTTLTFAITPPYTSTNAPTGTGTVAIASGKAKTTLPVQLVCELPASAKLSGTHHNYSLAVR